jgi:hypothetical protein
MSGNLWEWNDLTGTTGSIRGTRGGAYYDDPYWLSSSGRGTDGAPAFEGSAVGFRIAAVPEPSTWAMGAVGLACAAWGALRRRRRV